jgi:hypothetical protein
MFDPDPFNLLDGVVKVRGVEAVGHAEAGVAEAGGLSPLSGRTTSLYRSGYYHPGVVQDDMAVPLATYLSSILTMVDVHESLNPYSSSSRACRERRATMLRC